MIIPTPKEVKEAVERLTNEYKQSMYYTLGLSSDVKTILSALKAEQIYGNEKDATATVFMNQVKKLQAELKAEQERLDKLEDYIRQGGKLHGGVAGVVFHYNTTLEPSLRSAIDSLRNKP